MLNKIGISMDAIDPMADPNRLPEGVTQGPDGRIEHYELIDLEVTRNST